MSQDPQPEYNPDPERSYTDPSTYEVPSPPPPGVSPYPSYPEQPNYYGEQPPAGMPPQDPYSTPSYDPNQSGYGYNPNQGGYDPNQSGYYNPNQSGYGYQASEPLPLNEAVSQLPNQYIRVLTKPSPLTFAAEMGKASWNILWFQLIAYALIAGILYYVRSLMPWTSLISGTPNNPYSSVAYIATSYFVVFVIPIGFFIGQGIIFLLAKAFGGTGTFLQQGYTNLLITVPIGLLSSALGFIPCLGSLAYFGLFVYSIVLQIFSLMAVHRLNGGKATAVVLIPIGIVFVLAIIFTILVVVLVFSALKSTHPSYTP
jgi:hypothetical protein